MTTPITASTKLTTQSSQGINLVKQGSGKLKVLCQETFDLPDHRIFKIDSSQPKLVIKREQITPRGMRDITNQNMGDKAASHGEFDVAQSAGYMSSDME